MIHGVDDIPAAEPLPEAQQHTVAKSAAVRGKGLLYGEDAEIEDATGDHV